METLAETPKKRVRKKASKQPKMDMTQFDALIIGLTDYVASRPNCAHWKMTEKEVQSITEPLGNIIAKSDYMNQIAEHSDAIALVIACGTIFIPRIVITANIQKEKRPKKIPVQVQKNDRKEERNAVKSSGNTEENKQADKRVVTRTRTTETTANAGGALGDLGIGLI